ncbi:MAG TPA: hypothetical protein VFZ61_09265, partial [Polyangiales bacterium]
MADRNPELTLSRESLPGTLKQTLDIDPRLQSAVGLLLALCLIGALVAGEVWAIGYFRFEGTGWWFAPLLVALLSWLFV